MELKPMYLRKAGSTFLGATVAAVLAVSYSTGNAQPAVQAGAQPLLPTERSRHTFLWELYRSVAEVHPEIHPDDILGRDVAFARALTTLPCTDRIELYRGQLNIIALSRSRYFHELHETRLASRDLDNDQFRALVDMARNGTENEAIRSNPSFQRLVQLEARERRLAVSRQEIEKQRDLELAKCTAQNASGTTARSDIRKIGLIATIVGAFNDALIQKISPLSQRPIVVPVETQGDMPKLTLAAIVPGASSQAEDFRICFSDGSRVLITLRANASGRVTKDEEQVTGASSDTKAGTVHAPCLPYLRSHLNRLSNTQR